MKVIFLGRKNLSWFHKPAVVLSLGLTVMNWLDNRREGSTGEDTQTCLRMEKKKQKTNRRPTTTEEEFHKETQLQKYF